MDAPKGLNKNATRMLTGFIMGTIAMGWHNTRRGCIVPVTGSCNIFCFKRICENSGA